jgi:hypothetical protein
MKKILTNYLTKHDQTTLDIHAITAGLYLAFVSWCCKIAGLI